MGWGIWGKCWNKYAKRSTERRVLESSELSDKVNSVAAKNCLSSRQYLIQKEATIAR
jgi:hypothetical protein